MDYVYLSREDWGAAALPRLGHIVMPEQRTEVFIHHTVAIDDDATPNIWETLNEVKAWMKRLQTIRPDLGLDVPYSYVSFFMPDQLVVCEGRGVARTGAHTIGHNRSAIGMAVHGNFQLPTFGLTTYLPAIGVWLGALKDGHSLINLGNVHPPGRDVYGHRDVYQTACPGNHLVGSVPWAVLAAGSSSFISSPDITVIVQEVVDRGGWANGNDLTIIGDDTQSTLSFTSDDYSSVPGDSAKITIIHTAGGAGPNASQRLKSGVGR